MKRLIKIYSMIVVALTTGSCNKDLDLTPTNNFSAEQSFSSIQGLKSVLAKVYGSYALTGSGGSGSSDLGGIDAGTSDFLRLYWNAQELTTDEAACAWVNDANGGIGELDYMTWGAGNVLLQGLYTRSLYQITVANAFIKETTDAKLASKGITGADLTTARSFVAEARFLRAYQYWVLMDLFGNPPFLTEDSEFGTTAAKQIKRADLYTYIENELIAIEPNLVAARQNEYGRADKAAAWALLARMYLNAEVYTGTAQYVKAAEFAGKVINAGYSLHSQYANLFLGDNDKNNPEVILSINYDGVYTQNYGGTTYLINAAVNGAMNPPSFGVPNGGWGGNRSKPNLPNVFGDYSGNADKRAMFFGSKNKIDDITTFTDGLAVTKFKNVTSTGTTPASVGGTYCSTDFPLFRLAEMYLIYAEAVARNSSAGSLATATQYINLLRQRAYGNSSGNVTSVTRELILDERARELYWEGFRRTDLIRYGLYTAGSYLWPFKGGTAAGKAVESFRTLFPIPSADIVANPNLIQNTGY